MTDGHASATVLSHELGALEERLAGLEAKLGPAIAKVPRDRRESARNLVHYVALRQHDLRDLQLRLSQLGLSSLGRSEACVRANLLEVSLRVEELLALADEADKAPRRALRRLRKARVDALDWEGAKAYLHRHTREMLGPRPDDRHIYVMVTAPSARECDRAWMERMLAAGMNVLRVNCAHEDEEHWAATLHALDEARKATGRECRVLMDLAGPKIRTGAVGGARIATWKPAKDELGRVTTRAQIVLARSTAPTPETDRPVLVLSDGAFASLTKGDVLVLVDARGKRRRLTITETHEDRAVATADRRAYVLERADAVVERKGQPLGEVSLSVGGATSAAIDVRVGDPLLLTGREVTGRAPRRDADGRVRRPGRVACTLAAALDHLAVGQRVLFDDGRIEAVVEKVDGPRRDFRLRVVRTQAAVAKLRAEKGINLPDTVTTVPSLTAEDRAALRFVAARADLVGLSFVRRPDDVRELHAALDKLGRPDIGVILKIETQAGFENLPRILLEGLARPPLAVMIARGDLAVEVGFERLAELQEEILWLCEAAHLPTIWATQVLDTLARTGVPSRAEVTDAAASVAAECVMLNKGPFVERAVRVLVDILKRMEKHRYKKRNLFRKLRVSASL